MSITKALRWLWPPARSPEAEAEQQRLRAERKAQADRYTGPRGIPGMNPPSARDDVTDPRR